MAVTKLERMKHLTYEQSEALRNNFGEMSREIFKNEAKNLSETESRRYTEQIKQFAVLLHFYSPKAYKFVRKAFHIPQSKYNQILGYNWISKSSY